MDTKEIIQNQLKVLPEKLKTFISDESWRKDVENIGKKFNLSEENLTFLENEVFVVLICLEPRGDFAENIKSELNIDINATGWIAEDINKNVFSKVESDLDLMEKQINEGEGSGQVKTNQNNIGQSFEKIILNQAKAMQPAREAGSSSEQTVASSQAEEKPKVATPNYTGQDPYRETIE